MRYLAGSIHLYEQNLSQGLAAILARIKRFHQAVDLVNPLLGIEVAAAMKNDHGSWVGGRNILDQLVLEFGERKRPILAFTFVFIADSGCDDHGVVSSDSRRRRQCRITRLNPG